MSGPDAMRHVLAVVLAGGVGQRLSPLTRHRAKPAVPFGGIYRLIDFTLSNCLNSGCRRILVLVQYKSQSLHRHVRYAWNLFHPELGEYVEVIAPQMRVGESWYQGTADAIYQNLYSIVPENPKQVLILSGDHIYKMDYAKLLQFHAEAGAEVTVGAIEVPLAEGQRFGVLEVDHQQRVVGFEEKPVTPRPNPEKPTHALASMGIYVFNTEALLEACSEDARRTSSHDFGKDIIPQLIERHRVFAYPFVDENRKEAQYWRDVGTLEAYYEAQMDLVAVDPEFNLYDPAWPVRAAMPAAPPAKFVFADEGNRFGAALDSIVGPGSIISGSTVRRSVISPYVRVHSYAEIEDSILMNGVNIGRHCRIRRAIVDKNVNLPPGTEIGFNAEEDARQFHVTDSGITVLERQLRPPLV